MTARAGSGALPPQFAQSLRTSIARQERILRSSIVLNPVENFPFPGDIAVAAGPLHGLYNSDKVRDRPQRLEQPIQFAGRRALERDSRKVYDAFARSLGAADATLRLLAGLHAHTVLFLSVARPGQHVLLLPVTAGGHLSGKAILERRGLRVTHMAVDLAGQCIDIEATLEACNADPLDFVFVDRSEALWVEDLSWLTSVPGAVTVFDASQSLANVMSGHHPNPLRQGFGLLLASTHKNFPGPQKALYATRRRDAVWAELLSGTSDLVSNMHITSTYAAGLTLSRQDWLADYSKRMLHCAVELERALAHCGVPVVRRDPAAPPTHHVWVAEPGKAAAFAVFEALERCRILVNYRLLPYGLGHGIRMGTSALARLGLTVADVPTLAELIADVRRAGHKAEFRRRSRELAERLWERSCSTG